MTADTPTGPLVERVARALRDMALDDSRWPYIGEAESARLASDLLRRAGIGEPAAEAERLRASEAEDLVGRLRIKGRLENEKPNHTYRRHQVERLEAAALIERLSAASESPSGSDKAEFEFDRYINGALMAEGVVVERQHNLPDAMKVAARIAPKGPNGETPVLVLRAALVGNPRQATPVACRETPPVTDNAVSAEAIRAEIAWHEESAKQWRLVGAVFTAEYREETAFRLTALLPPAQEEPK